MLMKFLSLFAILFSTYCYSQQVPQFSQYNRNQYMTNPAAAGVYDFLDITIGGRMQWVGIDDAPMSSYLYASSPLGKPKSLHNPALRTSAGAFRNPEIKTGNLKHAIGGMLVADQYGAFRQIRGAVTYAIHVPIARNYNLSFGTNLGISNRTFLRDKAQVLSVLDPTSTVVDGTYDQFVANQGAQNTMDLGLGLYFYSNELFVGLSADQVTKDFVRFGNTNMNLDTRAHLYLTAGYKIPIAQNFTLMPSILVKYINPAPVSFEGTLQLEYKEWLWFGVSYRNQDAVVGMLGLNVSDRFKLGYSYDFNISKLSNTSSGGHEVVLGLMLGR
jgi:type IX secretion system PorP/SprF family membrane protein